MLQRFDALSFDYSSDVREECEWISFAELRIIPAECNATSKKTQRRTNVIVHAQWCFV